MCDGGGWDLFCYHSFDILDECLCKWKVGHNIIC